VFHGFLKVTEPEPVCDGDDGCTHGTVLVSPLRPGKAFRIIDPQGERHDSSSPYPRTDPNAGPSYSGSMKARGLTIILAGAALLAGATFVFVDRAFADRLEETFYVPLDHPAIQYVQEPGDDPVWQLEKKLRAGQAKLDYDPNHNGYLPALLKAFDINIDSQVLVFSKTSIQAEHINPRTPRAIYFNDNVTVGIVLGGDVLELTSVDPKRGVFMYSLDFQKRDKPGFARRDDCLRCHEGPITMGVPGLVVSSLHPRTPQSGDVHGFSFMSDHRTPFEERWGGWYVTGMHGGQRHLGNNLALMNALNPGGPNTGDQGQNWTTLPEVFDASRYLTNTSDLVALMTLEHQSRMTNLITRIGWDFRIADADGKVEDRTGEALQKQLNEEIDEFVTYMLFADEAPLKAPVAGVSTFTKTFPERGPKNSKGRSLRDFDLKTRLFRYPLSYMIYSVAFDNMPDSARERVYRRLYDVLSGKDQGKDQSKEQSEKFAKLSADDRKAVLEIVRETKRGLPDYWAADK
jgi:hypothetical protein